MKTIKTAAILSVLLIIITTFDACRKKDLNEQTISTSKKADNAAIERAKKAIQAKGELVSVVMPIDQKASDVYFSDGNNKRIDMVELVNQMQASRISVCDYQYDVNGDPIDDMFPSNFDINSIGFIYDCSAGGGSPNNYRVTLEWGLAVHHSILAQNNYGPGGGMLRSRYTLKIKNSSGVTIATYSNNYLLFDDIHDLGDWSVDPTRTLYKINASINVPTSVFTNGVTYETTITLATDCSYTPQLTGVYTETSVNSLNTQPCLRTDKVWVNPGTGPNGEMTGLGTFAICTPPFGYTVSANHQIQYRLKNQTNDSWESQTSTIYPGSSSYITIDTYGSSIGYLTNMTSGTGTWLVRYRNDNSCSPSAPWFVEKWPL